MQIGCLGWLNGETPIVDWQRALQELIRCIQRGNVHEPHPLDHSILNGLKEPLDPPFACGEWAGISATPRSPSVRPH